MSDHLNSERWFVTVDYPEGFNKEDTEQSLQSILKSENYDMRGDRVSEKHYGEGRFQLALLRSNSGKNNKKNSNMKAHKTKQKYGTNSLRVAVFYATIFCHVREAVNITVQRELDFD